MAYGICPLSAVAIRNTSTDSSEMISQLLFGELVEVLEVKGHSWLKVHCLDDNCVGWVAANQLKLITPSEWEAYRNHYAWVLDYVQAAMSDDHYLPLTLGARLPGFDGMRFILGETSYSFSGQAVFPKDIHPSAELLLKIARRYLNTPYIAGGKSPLGMDASGLTQIVYRIAGIQLPREADQQVFLGETIDFVEQSKPGDLAFFENRLGKITHVGIVVNPAEVLHVFGRVCIDGLDHYGVYNREAGRYLYKLRVIKRLLKSGTPTEKTTESSASAVYSNQFELF
jgi:hypothetical protein